MLIKVIGSGSSGEEVWREIPGFEKYYSISNYGRLKSFKEKPEGRILKSTNKKGDYFSFVLCAGGNKKSTRIHRLVAEAFLPNLNNFPETNHIDGNKQNNRVENLEWVSRSDNVKHSMLLHPWQTKAMNYYNMFVRPKKIVQYSLSSELLNVFVSAREASIITGVCQRNILQVCNKDEFSPGRVRKQAGGYRWEFEKC